MIGMKCEVAPARMPFDRRQHHWLSAPWAGIVYGKQHGWRLSLSEEVGGAKVRSSESGVEFQCLELDTRLRDPKSGQPVRAHSKTSHWGSKPGQHSTHPVLPKLGHSRSELRRPTASSHFGPERPDPPIRHVPSKGPAQMRGFSFGAP
jgi:hypothetical protein